MTAAREVIAYVGLGANLGTAEEITARFDAAVAAMAAWPFVRATRRSAIRVTRPVGPVLDQPRFLNAVVELTLVDPPPPVEVLEALLALEGALGRVREGAIPQGPRAIDLDLLLFGDVRCDEPGPPALVLPHPRMHERAFVLIPLAELRDD